MTTETTTPVRWVARNLTPIVLGLLLLGYVLDAIYMPPSESLKSDVYTGLIVASVLLTVAFATLFVTAWLGRRSIWRTWLILLAATLMITGVGVLTHRLIAPSIEGEPLPVEQEFLPFEPEEVPVEPEEVPAEPAPEMPAPEEPQETLSLL